MKKLYIVMFAMLASCSALEESEFGKKYYGSYKVTADGAAHLSEYLDTGLTEGSILTIDKYGCLFFTDENGKTLSSGLDVLNDGFFVSMAAYYVIMKAEKPALVGKKFGISVLRGWISITDIADTKPEGKPDPLYDVTGAKL